MRKLLVSVLLVSALALVGSSLADAESRPFATQESARVALPAGYTGQNVAIEGDWILASASYPESRIAFLLYQRRSASSWTLNRTLLDFGYDPESLANGPRVALENGIAAVIANGGQLAVFEKANGWARAPVASGGPSIYSHDIRIDGQRILVGTGNCGDAAIFERDATGTWRATAQLQGSGVECGDGSQNTRTLDLSGDYALVPSTVGDSAGPLYTFRRNATSGLWVRTGSLPVDQGNLVPDGVALRGSVAVASPGRYYYVSPSLHWWVRSGPTWTSRPTIRALDAYSGNGGWKGIKQRGDWLVQRRADPDVGPGVVAAAIDVYRQNAQAGFDRVARLRALTNRLRDDVAVYENRIVAATPNLQGTGDDLVVFELPASLATPAAIRDDFEGGNSATWQPAGGAQFSIVAANDTHHYRQAATAAFATATLNNSDWVNQAIEAEVGANSNTAATGYAGVGVRWDGTASGYFARIRNDQTLQLVKRVAGVETILGALQSAGYAGRHRLQIEARGKLLSVYVDGAAVLQAQDAALKHGQAVLVTSFTNADFDNVYVSPLRQSIFNAEFRTQPPDAWTVSGGSWDYTRATESNSLFKTQLSATGAARAITGVATDDQVNEARVRADTTSTSDSSWVGVMARYVDSRNLYYLSLRGGRLLLLRKVVDGVATDLWYEYPSTASNQTFHTIRLEATGDRLRAFFDGQFEFEVRDSSIARGRPAIATNNSKATFASFSSYQP